METDKEFLGTEPVGKLLFRLSIPTVVAQLINMLYNIVDRIYIGHMPGDGSLALTGVGVCMPLINKALSAASLAAVAQLAEEESRNKSRRCIYEMPASRYVEVMNFNEVLEPKEPSFRSTVLSRSLSQNLKDWQKIESLSSPRRKNRPRTLMSSSMMMMNSQRTNECHIENVATRVFRY